MMIGAVRSMLGRESDTNWQESASTLPTVTSRGRVNPLRHAPALAIVGVLTACSGILEPALPAGSREWRISVENLSAAPARLVVAEDEAPIGDIVGTAVPSTVAPGTTELVVFTVPPGQDWAIFVNPSPQLGPLILARDVPPNVAGALPLTIMVQGDGSPTVSVPDDPGWFGN
jgi:hypothetical protein